MIYAPTFAQCYVCGGFWDDRQHVGGLCPVCTEAIRQRSQREAIASVNLARRFKATGLFFIAASAIIIAFGFFWRFF